MSILEYSGGKIFTSTGASPWQDAWSAETVGEVTFHRAAYQVRARVTNMTSTGTVTVRWFGN